MATVETAKSWSEVVYAIVDERIEDTGFGEMKIECMT